MDRAPLAGSSDPAIALGLEDVEPRLRWRLLAALAAGLVALALVSRLFAAPTPRAWASERVRVGDLVVTVTATGTLQPIDQVDVGSELSGTVRSVAVGFNESVRAGQVLARLDTERLESQVLQSQASLASARASVDQARANLAEATSQQSRLVEVRKLSGGKIPAQQDLAAGDAAVARARAAVKSAEAAVAQAEATLGVQQADLAKAVIRSPIDGIVLGAAVRPGQTVAASLQAPVLFTLARDLTRMQLDMSIDEADVGQVREGQTARFAVDAWPGRTFTGTVTQVRYGARTVGGVVTYEAILAVDNPELLLRPGMTATAQIEVRHDTDALLVPNAALRFEPPARDDARERGLAGWLRRTHAHDLELREAGAAHEPRVFLLRDGHLAPVAVAPGASDGAWTEIAPGAIAAGARVAVEAAPGA